MGIGTTTKTVSPPLFAFSSLLCVIQTIGLD